jgi:hypothetical protein
MRLNKLLIILTVTILLFVIIFFSMIKLGNVFSNKIIEKGIAFNELSKDENIELAKELYRNIYRDSVSNVKKILKDGADPNYCVGECGWLDSNPLSVVNQSFYGTFYRLNEKIPTPYPDVAIAQLLLKAGADISARPYIWERVNRLSNKEIRRLNKSDGEGHLYNVEIMQQQQSLFIADANRLIHFFLKSGADPDKLGHPYPFSVDAVYGKITDAEANEYFQKGTRAINVAIEKGMAWESQVDLLLEYTTLDEDSLKSAEQSGDIAMIEKIQRIWDEQQKN